jgi:glyoxylase-like metal-dependent hydrolase (beta-lactamase superfamily II)
MKILGFILITMVLFSCAEKEDNLHIQSDNFELTKLAPGVYGCTHKLGGNATCNVGVVDNGRETFIFDSFLSPHPAEELIKGVEASNLSPIKYLINSHFHNDHIRGNQAFPDDVTIISTTRTRELIEKWEPINIAEEKEYAPQRFEYFDSLFQNFTGDQNSKAYRDLLMWRPYFETLAKSHDEIQTRLPETFVDSTMTFKGPSREVQLITIGGGHTESDLVMYLPDDKILFAADLIFSNCHPYLADGTLRGSLEWLDYLSTLDIETVLPGHGPIGSKSVITDMKNYILEVESTATNFAEQGSPEEELQNIPIPEKYAEYWFDQFFYSNLRFALQNKE